MFIEVTRWLIFYFFMNPIYFFMNPIYWQNFKKMVSVFLSIQKNVNISNLTKQIRFIFLYIGFLSNIIVEFVTMKNWLKNLFLKELTASFINYSKCLNYLITLYCFPMLMHLSEKLSATSIFKKFHQCFLCIISWRY